MYMCEVDTDDNMLILNLICTCTNRSKNAMYMYTCTYLCIISSFFFKQRYKENMKRRDDEIKKLSTKYDIEGKEVTCH